MIVIDVETTGVNPEKNSLLSIGAVYFENPKKTFYEECRVWDGAEIEDEALQINGFRKEETTNPEKLPQDALLKNFLFWMKDCKDKTLAGQNPFFDNSFLISAFKRNSLEHPFGRRIIDLHTIAYLDHLKRGIPILLNKERTNIDLNTILRYVGLPEEPKPHNALTGALMEAEAFNRIIYCKPLLEEFSKYPLPDYLSK